MLLYPFSRSIANTDEVVGQLLYGRGCGTRLDGFGVVGDEDGLGGFDDHDALFAL